MDEQMRQHLSEYDRAVARCGETYTGMSSDERVVRQVSGRQLEEHAPSDRTNPTCTGCEGQPWPCTITLGAIAYSDPRLN
ncbi:hypothetical protein [Streptomyces goshikiensis]|uniref:hypothetical protein n=1 Tax=Streptomyces goshikiensis TaxID=1942 RepID=UPI0037A6D43F